MDNTRVVDINNAGLEELTSLPGVGPALAKRIMDARPFETVEELPRVSGLSLALLERLRPYLELSEEPKKDEALESEQIVPPPGEDVVPDSVAIASSEEAGTVLATLEDKDDTHGEIQMMAKEKVSPDVDQEAQDEISGKVSDVDEMESPIPEDELKAPLGELPMENETQGEAPVIAGEIEKGFEVPSKEEEVPEMAEAPAKVSTPTPVPVTKTREVTHSSVFWIALGVGLVIMILTVILNIAILAGINKGVLQYASLNQAYALESQLDTLGESLGVLQEDLSSLRSRVDNLEALSGRVSALEQSVEEMQGEVDAVVAQYDELDQRVEEIGDNVEVIRSETERFQGFFERLRQLLDEVFTVEEESQ